MRRLLVASVIVAVILARFAATSRGAEPPPDIPDLTRGGTVPGGVRHDWNLGPTGLRGWMHCDTLVTKDARQILVTRVDEGSPADGLVRVGDVILGVGGEPFESDPRVALGRAITHAESEAGGGRLLLTRWRDGATEEVVVGLPVLGSYGPTAPFDCPKSRLVFERGCRALAGRMAEPDYGDGGIDPIPRSLAALALLASGDAAHLALVRREAEWAAGFTAPSMQTWHYGYCIMLLSEYVMATGDRTVMPGLRRLALEAADGQSAVGSWGHGFARPDGRLGGYGMMNAPGLPLTIGLVLARDAGVDDPEVTRAIERSTRLLRFYVGKGAVPYGDHHPWIETHEDNGKCGMAAVLFGLLGEGEAAEFFSRMSVASHGPERDCGHTGNYFNLLWAMPGVAQAGPHATGAWMEEFGGWYFDLARRWDGTSVHQGPPERDPDSYAGWDGTGAALLALAMPRRAITLTGKRASIIPQLDGDAARALVADGRGWDNADRTSAADACSTEELLRRLGSWSPVVRERAAMALARRGERPLEALIGMLDDGAAEARLGACQALAALRQRGAPAVGALERLLSADDLWLRIKAADALAAIGEPAMQAVPRMLELLATADPVGDPRGMQQRYLAFALFEPGSGLLSRSLEGVDREALFAAVRVGLANQDGRARGSIGSVYRNLTAAEIGPLLPAIHRAIVEPAPSGEMFADTIRVEGLRLLAKHRIAEGMPACVRYLRDQNPWSSENRTPELMTILAGYGAHAKAVIPELRAIADFFEHDEQDFPRHLSLVKAESVRGTIRAIEASEEFPELVPLDAAP